MKRKVKKLAILIIFSMIINLTISFLTLADFESNVRKEKIATGSNANYDIASGSNAHSKRKNSNEISFQDLIPEFEINKYGILTTYNGSGGEVVIPDGVVAIKNASGNDGVFTNSGITSIVFPDSLREIGNRAFAGCEELTGELNLPKALRKIGDGAFLSCNGLTGKLEIPYGVEAIATGAFCGCTGFDGDLVIPDSVSYLGHTAFEGCTGFTGKLVISSNIAQIYPSTFRMCTGLSGDLIIPDGVISIGQDAFYNCNGFTGNLILPNSLVTIEDGAFRDCSRFIGDLTIPNSVTSIEYGSAGGAFQNCTGFTGKLTISENLNKITDSTFENCSGLSGELFIPENITAIGSNAFKDCSSLTGNLEIPNNIKEIGANAFEGCSGFNGKLIISENLTKISANVFRDCKGLAGEVTIPTGATKIDQYAFSGCSSLTKIIIPDSIIDIGEGAFSFCSNLSGRIKLPMSLKTIGDYAFKSCIGLTGDLTIPSSVRSLGVGAFEDCKGFNGELVLPDKISVLKASVFAGCDGFTGDLKLPEYISSIEEGHGLVRGAFEGCNGFNGKLILSNTLNSIGAKAFEGCSGLTGELLVPESVFEIGQNAFKNCSGFSGELRLPQTIKTIGRGAFWGCKGLTGELALPIQMTCVENETFYGCKNLKSIIISKNIKEIKDYAFANCTTVNKAVILDNVSLISPNAFYSNVNLTIYGMKDSYVYSYASENNIPFAIIDIPILKIALKYEEFIPIVIDDFDQTENLNKDKKYFIIKAEIDNIGSTVAKEIIATIDLPDGLKIYGIHFKEQYLGNLEPNEKSVVEWQVMAEQKNNIQQLRYVVWIRDQENLVFTNQSQIINVDAKLKESTFDISDKWNFEHAGFENYSCGKYYGLLLEDLTVKEKFKMALVVNGWKWNGSCFGMSLGSILFKYKNLHPNIYKENAKSIMELNRDESKDLINYLHLLQHTNFVRNRFNKITRMEDADKIKLIENMLEESNLPILLSFSYDSVCVREYKTDVKTYKKGDKEHVGHTVVLCGAVQEADTDSGYIIKGSDIKYQKRVPIYDVNEYGYTYQTYFYFTDEDNPQWYIQDCNSYSTFWKRTKIEISDICNDINDLNYKNPEGRLRMIGDDPEISSVLSVKNTVEYKVRYGDTIADIDGLDRNGNLPIKIYYSPNISSNGIGAVVSNIILPENGGVYEIIPKDTEQLTDLCLDIGSHIFNVKGTKCDNVTFDSVGSISMNLSNGSYNISMIGEEENNSLPYYEIDIEGNDTEKIKLEKQKDGYIISSDQMNNIQVVMKNDVEEEKVLINTNEDTVKVKVSDNDKKIIVMIDKDKDGNYETSINSSDSGNIDSNILQNISLNYSEIILDTGDTVQLIASTKPVNVTGIGFVWKSSNPEIASVSDGIVKANIPGVVIVTVSAINYPSFYAQCRIEVKDNGSHSGGSSGGGSGSGGGGSKGGAGSLKTSGPNQMLPDTYPGAVWSQLADGQWKLIKVDENMVLGWALVKNKWYYLDPVNGLMKVGWQLIDNKWYYLNADGSMATGWIFINEKWYYLDASGAMLADTITPDGYRVNTSGEWIPQEMRSLTSF